MSHYPVDDVDSAVRHLNHLIGAICNIQFESDVGKADECVSALLWIARDISEGIIHQMDEESAAALAKRERARA